MVVAMVAMRMVQMAVDEIIDVIAMWHGLMTATGSMDMRGIMTSATMFRGAVRRVFLTYLDNMLVDMTIMRMVKMTVMQIINMVAVANSNVSATGFVLVIMVMMMRQSTITHNYFLKNMYLIMALTACLGEFCVRGRT